MTLHIYDSLTREKREFVPLVPGKVSIYLCGATVQGAPHIGHLRSAIAFDVLRRWLIAGGNDVIFIRNVTDIDDKILHKAQDAGRPWWEWAATHERLFTQAYNALGVMPPSAEPHATGFITQMVEYIDLLISRGHAYAADGDVYFRVRSLPTYGELTNQKVDELHQGESLGVGKEDPSDFTLWKSAKPGEPSWPTPWGAGRPGWHLECSAMIRSLLGPEFDIHCGGMDLQFPHHENEIAQAHGIGDGFARYWMHNGWVTMAGEKMSKSLGNTVSIEHMLAKVRPVELRYYLGMAHYRSMQEYSDAALTEAATAYRRIESFVRRAAQHRTIEPGVVPDDFATSMNDDLGVPQAIAVIHNAVRAGNTALEQRRLPQALDYASQVRAMTRILGVDPLDPHWNASNAQDTSSAMTALDVLVQAELERRAHARDNKDWAVADQVRDRLKTAGIIVTDTSDGAQWSLTDNTLDSAHGKA